MKLTPDFMVSFETVLKGLVTGNWDRVVANLMWDRLMKTRPMAGKKEILTWLLESAQIYPEGDGGNKRFDDIVAATFSYENTHAGAGLELTRDEIEDNQLKDNPSVGALDYASKWARDIGAAAAYYPQQQLFSLILNGKTNLAYDGQAFFSASHPVNPNGGGGTYSNLITAVPLVVTSGSSEQDNLLLGRKNLGKALAAVRKQRFVNGVPRFLKPTTLLVQSDLVDYANLLVKSAIVSQTSNDQRPGASLEVIGAPELDTDTAGAYYIGVEDMLSDELGAFVWGERDAFTMSMYGPQTEAWLKRQNRFLWEMDGRNTAIYGHPYMFYRCEAT